jgi:hypothetical protein
MYFGVLLEECVDYGKKNVAGTGTLEVTKYIFFNLGK